MAYKTRITETDGKYVGTVLDGETVVYTTNYVSDPILATREIVKFMSSNSQPASLPMKPAVSSTSQKTIPNNAVPVNNRMMQQPLQQQEVAVTQASTQVNVPTRKCCGRG